MIFENVKDVREMIYDFYSRNFADKIPGGKNDNDAIDVISINLEIAKLARKKQEFQSKKIFKPAKHILLPLIYDLVRYFLKDSDLEIGFLKGNGYYLGEYLLAYCYIVAIGMFKTAYLLSLKGDSDLLNQPSILYPKERLISDIAETVEISEESAKKVIEDMTYNYEFHKDRITIYQPLFEVGDYIICSSYLVFHSYVIDKVMKYFDVKGINKQDLTVYHKYKSDQMNHRMASNLPQMYSNLRTFENCILDFGSIRKAEVDIVLFDTANKQAVLVELKNYTPVDNEIDALTKEKRINNAIDSRLEKDKRVFENLELFFKENNLPIEYLKYDFASLLVTNSYTGGVGVKEKIKVIDEALFYYLLDIYNGNMSELLASLDEGTFFKELKQVVSIKDQHYSYKGINVVVSNKN